MPPSFPKAGESLRLRLSLFSSASLWVHRREPSSRAQRHVLCPGEINASQRVAWQKAIAVFDERDGQTRRCALFPHDRMPPLTGTPAVQVQLAQLQLFGPRF